MRVVRHCSPQGPCCGKLENAARIIFEAEMVETVEQCVRWVWPRPCFLFAIMNQKEDTDRFTCVNNGYARVTLLVLPCSTVSYAKARVRNMTRSGWGKLG